MKQTPSYIKHEMGKILKMKKTGVGCGCRVTGNYVLYFVLCSLYCAIFPEDALSD